ncbi:protease [Lysinibacillus sp. B2A1]|nr:protease [Lysinibacillus sp. B2A1]
MFIPKYYKVTDVEEIKKFIRLNAFATIVSIKKGRPIATHLPLLLSKQGDDYYLTGHLAYGNPQWRTFQETDEVLVMFQGPHAYISSSWYEQENVPTWNYQSVHVYGKAETFEGKELEKDLSNLLEKYEKHREHPVLWETLSPQLLEQELKGIVGVKIKVQDIQAAYKLSQNRNKEDYSNIIHQLYEENDSNACAIAEEMKRLERGHNS